MKCCHMFRCFLTVFRDLTYCVLKLLNIKIIQGESLARGPKLSSIKNYVIEIMT